jgi:type I restriction-modification system DNA methylase subunit
LEAFLATIAREQFSQPAAESLFKKLEQLSHRSGVSRGVAFEDWLTAMVCALAAETKEGEYLAMIERHKEGKAGKRGCDLMGQMFGELVNAMSESEADILGDLFQGAITYGEAGQYFTPESITKLLAQMSIDPDARPENGRPILINDPLCCAQHNGSSVAQVVMWRSAICGDGRAINSPMATEP